MLVRTVAVSIGLGVAAWLIVHALLLPVVDVSHGQGHGPDMGSAEWHSAVVRQTEAKERRAALSGLIVGILSIPICLVLERRKGRVPDND